MKKQTHKPHSLILTSISRFIFVFVNIFAIYLFLKGHNQPGGGFIAGIASAISMVLLSMTLGIDRIKKLMYFDSVTIAAVGLIMAYTTGLAPHFFGHFFLYHKMFHITVPLLGGLHIGTPLFFDLGVYLVVLGVTSKSIMILTYSMEGRSNLVEEEQHLYAATNEKPIEKHRVKAL